jgi:hypothetical protein
MKRKTVCAFLIVALVVVSGLVCCGDSKDDVITGFNIPPVLESTTSFTYDRNDNVYSVNIDSNGGEYVFSAPNNTILSIGYIHRNATWFYNDDIYSFQNEYLSAKLEGHDITISIAPNLTDEGVTYNIHVYGLDSYTRIVFNQSKAK